jgi:predicted Zn-dependent protease
MKKLLLIFSFFVLTTTIYSCYTNPITGRKSLSLVDPSTMQQMASQEYASFLATNKPQRGTRDAEMVQRVGSRLASAVQTYLNSINQSQLISGYNWEFNLVNNNEANAWCMPGGKVAVYTGIMPLAQNEAGLATVMGHEIAHAVARHSSERASQQLVAQYGSQALSAVLGSNPGAASQVFNAAVGIGAQGALLKFSRDQESEADHMGVIFMALAGYNPNEALNFWSRMSAQSGANPPEILSSHPSDQTRINNLRKWIPDAMKYYKPQG